MSNREYAPLVASKNATVWSAIFCLVAALILFSLIPSFFHDPNGELVAISLPVREAVFILIATVILWCTKPIPIVYSSLLPLAAFPLLGVMTPSETLKAFSNPLVFVIGGCLLIANEIHYWKFDQRTALRFLELAGPNRHATLFFMIALTGFASMWVYNGMLAAILFPTIVWIVRYKSEFMRSRELQDPRLFTSVLVCGAAFGISIGGFSNILGTPINIALFRFMHKTFYADVSLVSWTLMGLVLFILCIPCCYWVMRSFLDYAPRSDDFAFQDFLDKKKSRLATLTWRSIAAILIVMATVLSWSVVNLTRILNDEDPVHPYFTHLNITVLALIALFALRLSNQKTFRPFPSKDSFSFAPMWVVVFLGSCFVLTGALETTGAMGLFGGALTSWLSHYPSTLLPILAIFILVLANIFPNAVMGGLMAVFLTSILKTSPTFLNKETAIFLTLLPSAIFFLPTGDLHSMVLYGTKTFTFKDYLRCGTRLSYVLIPIMMLIPWLAVSLLFHPVPSYQNTVPADEDLQMEESAAILHHVAPPVGLRDLSADPS